MKKLIAVLLALSCMLIGAAAVAETLNIAYMPNYGSLWAVETAINKGYFEEEGLTINLVEFADGPTIIAAMESGSIDMGYIGQGAHKLCINGRASIFALSHISNGDALIGGKGIATVEDLKGKVVAYSSGTSSEDILKNSLDKAGMTMDDIKAMDMDASAIVTAMLSGGVDGILELLDLGVQTLGDLRRKLRVNELTLYVRIGGSDDPAKAAMGYGRAWAAIGAITPSLERLFVIKKRDIQPALDYTISNTQVDAHLVTTITIGRSLALALRAGIRFLKILNERKKAV